MRKSLAVIGAILLSALTASATDFERTSVFLGYNFVRFNPNSDFIPSFNANGGGGQFAYNFNRWISGVVDLGVVHLRSGHCAAFPSAAPGGANSGHTVASPDFRSCAGR